MTLTEIYRRCSVQGECRIWKGGLSRNGHPYIHCPEKYAAGRKQTGKGGGSRSGRRVVWKLKHGAEAAGIVVMTCGNKLCLNPAHMKDGTRSDVQRIASASGHLDTIRRRVSRAINGMRAAKLTHAKAAAIRAELAPMTGYRNAARHARMVALAAEYGVSLTCINDVRVGKRWATPAPLYASSVWALAGNDAQIRRAA